MTPQEHSQLRSAITLAQQGNLPRALDLLLSLAANNPQDPAIHHNLAVAAALAHDARALPLLQSHAHLHPQDPAAHFNLANVLHHTKNFDAALEEYNATLALDPRHISARHHRALIHLARGNLPAALPDFERRFDLLPQPPVTFSPRWDGQAPVRTLLLYAEQGLGDTIFALRFARALKPRIPRILLQSPPELATLARTASGIDDVIPQGQPLPPHDAHLPILSLMQVLNLKNPPNFTPYLTPPSLSLDIPHPATGICWTGRQGIDNARHLPAGDLISALENQGPLISLCPQSPTPLGILDLSPHLQSLAQTAALLMSLDHIVTVDTVIANLAGAMGLKATVLLKWLPDWRWQPQGTKTPWYPTLRLLRQASPNDWSAPLSDLHHGATESTE